MPNSMLVFTFYVLGQKNSFSENFVKNRKLLKVKFDSKNNSNMHNSMVVAILSVLDFF